MADLDPIDFFSPGPASTPASPVPGEAPKQKASFQIDTRDKHKPDRRQNGERRQSIRFEADRRSGGDRRPHLPEWEL